MQADHKHTEYKNILDTKETENTLKREKL